MTRAKIAITSAECLTAWNIWFTSSRTQACAIIAIDAKCGGASLQPNACHIGASLDAKQVCSTQKSAKAVTPPTASPPRVLHQPIFGASIHSIAHEVHCMSAQPIP